MIKAILYQYFGQIPKINNSWQLAAFLIVSIFLLIFLSIAQNSLIKVLSTIALSIILLFLFPFFKEYLDYHRSKDWNKRINEYQITQDQTKSPAYVASAGMERMEGKKLAYNHVLKEIEDLERSKTPDKQKLLVLKERIKGSINSSSLY